MNRATALLVLGALMLIVVNLFGTDGTMSRVAGMNKNELRASIDRAAPPVPGTSPWSGGGDADSMAIVQPTVVGDPDDVVADIADLAESIEADSVDPGALPQQSGSVPEANNETSFDPRIG